MSRTDIAILAKAPLPGFAKTRLIPSIGAHAAAVLQERLTKRVAEAAAEAGTGAVTLWCTPDPAHVSFRELALRHALTLRRQPDGDLGRRMLAAMADSRPALVIGTDCPALTTQHLREAAAALHGGADIVLIPAEDGGYVLIGARARYSALFESMPWGTDRVLAETRRRTVALGLATHEMPALWDLDTEKDLARSERAYPALALG